MCDGYNPKIVKQANAYALACKAGKEKEARAVLNRVNVSYPIPGGEYSTFSNGHPVSAMIQLRFTEMSIIHRQRIEEGY